MSNPQRFVLIVEDSDDCATTIEIALASMPGVSVTVAATAEEALRVLDSVPVVAIVTDLHLPAMDGLELVARIRSRALNSGVPIVVISGDAHPGTPERALRGGASAFFSKPYSPGAVRRTLEELIDAK